MPGVHPTGKRPPLLLWFLAFLLATVAWQAFYCFTSTDGDPSGLFFAGVAFRVPPELQSSFRYPHSTGYDGQFYRILAHDPLDRKGYWAYLDNPRYRSHRVLIPALASLLGGRSSRAVDFAYIAITDVLLAWGAICFLALVGDAIPAWLALALYALIPAIVASTDRMVLDGPAVAGFLAALLWFRERRWVALGILLALLPLMRETAVCVNAGVALVFFLRREYRRMAWAGATVVPTLGWSWFCDGRTVPSGTLHLLSLPLWPQIARLFQLYPRPLSPPLNVLLEALDLMGCLCLLWAIFYFGKILLAELRKGEWKEDTLIVLPSVVLAAVASSPDIMLEGYGFLRIDSILLAWVLLRMIRWRPGYAAAYAGIASLGLGVYRAVPFLKFLGLHPR